MTNQETSFFEQANEIMANIMFCAAPKELVSVNNTINKYFYTISCLELINNRSYVLFIKIFKPLKRRKKSGAYFSLHTGYTELLSTPNDTDYYLREFLLSFGEHERSICDFSSEIDSIPAGDALLLINEWEKSIFEYYNQIIPNINKQNRN